MSLPPGVKQHAECRGRGRGRGPPRPPAPVAPVAPAHDPRLQPCAHRPQRHRPTQPRPYGCRRVADFSPALPCGQGREEGHRRQGLALVGPPALLPLLLPQRRSRRAGSAATNRSRRHSRPRPNAGASPERSGPASRSSPRRTSSAYSFVPPPAVRRTDGRSRSRRRSRTRCGPPARCPAPAGW